ncbi:ATP-dependent Clp protease ATP-binding subunit [candidate division NPL-UPA2 bacterium]|nr:ATP-dependent Clp protease ATP-binding subunit [candidate division NPL-UPA2 bacterium]
MFDRFTERVRKVMVLARQEARRLNHDYIGVEHFLLGLIKMGEGLAIDILQGLGVDLDSLRLEVERTIKSGPSTLTVGEIPFTPRSKKVLELAVDEARNLGHNYVGTEHLLLGLIREREGPAARILEGMGVSLEKARQKAMEFLEGSAPPPGGISPSKKSKTPALDAFGRDLTELAREDKLDPVIGREDEIERITEILSRRTKNNPVLLGEAGVGKTAIVEGLAQKIVAGSVPDILSNKRIVALDLALMVAGTKYRGQFEERIKAVMQEIRRSEDIIVLIDELHTLVGAGAAEGAIDASNILKPALSRGEMQCIGATTLDEYRKYIERDSALERRFQMIMVEPPTVAETIEILKGLRDKYEAHHRARFTDQALEAATKLADRYIAARLLPDKAIDVIDEAGARAHLSVATAPPDVKEMDKKIEDLRREKEASVKAQEFEEAAKFRDRERKLREKLAATHKEWKESVNKKEALVTEETVAEIVSKWTGIPISRLEEKETEKLLRMEEELHKRVVGQNEALTALTQAVRRSRSGLKDPERPIGSFIFLGPTGVGKTELARTLAEFLFGDEEALIRLDMSEYMERFSVSRLIGAPPGYVGYEEGGQLTERVRRRPYAVVLLDEIEKAHPDVFNILLQVLEDGRLTDSLNRTVDFRNVVLIMTSNVGAPTLKKTLGFSAEDEKSSYESIKEKLLGDLKKVFRPEFLNRIDETIVFRSLTREELKEIVNFMLEEVRERLSEKKLKIEISPQAKEFFINKGYDPFFGARPLRRAIQRYLENSLAEEILKGNLKEGTTIKVGVKNGKLSFK